MFSTVSVTAAVCHPHVVSIVGELHGCIRNILNKTFINFMKYFVYALRNLGNTHVKTWRLQRVPNQPMSRECRGG